MDIKFVLEMKKYEIKRKFTHHLDKFRRELDNQVQILLDQANLLMDQEIDSAFDQLMSQIKPMLMVGQIKMRFDNKNNYSNLSFKRACDDYLDDKTKFRIQKDKNEDMFDVDNSEDDAGPAMVNNNNENNNNNHHNHQQQQQQIQETNKKIISGGNNNNNSHSLGRKKNSRFICSIESCGKHFSSRFNLKRHQLSHQSIKPFYCRFDKSYCSYASNDQSNVLRHIQKSHLSKVIEESVEEHKLLNPKQYLGIDSEVLINI